MSKRKFLSTNREHFPVKRSQERVSQQLRGEHKQEQPRELLVPIDMVTRKQPWHGKPMRSEGKSSEREGRVPVFELLNLKESLLLKPHRDTFNIKHAPKKRTSTNRIATEKLPHPTQPSHSADRKPSNHKILIRGGGYHKEPSPERDNYIRHDLDKIWATEKTTEPEPAFASSRRSLEKKLTAFEREESKQFEVVFIGSRRVGSLEEFTDGEGDSRVGVGEAIAYKYEVVSTLGRGSFGRVFKAYDHKKKEFVALKVIKKQEKFSTQAKVEIRILETALLHDPKLRNNIVRLKGSFVFRGHTCLKFEVLSKNLYEFIRETNFAGFSLDLIRRFTIQMLQALHFLTQHGIIHCDLKPENILLKEENKSGIKVIDVGSGCFDGQQIYTYIQSRFYRAPEIILGLKYTSAIDMWSLGCILVELHTGLPLFPGENEQEQVTMLIELLGLPPRPFLERAERRKKYFTDDYECKIPASKSRDKLRKVMNWKSILGADCDSSFLRLVQRCLEWDPAARMTPREALLDEWVISGLPHTIRSQHVEQLRQH